MFLLGIVMMVDCLILFKQLQKLLIITTSNVNYKPRVCGKGNDLSYGC